ncbi:MAG: thiamine phosphate synthase, partial [Nocardioidaceae bacterium]
RSRLYLCTDARRGTGDLADFVARVVGGGVDIVQVRDDTLTAVEELMILDRVREVCAEAGALFAVNDRADFARASHADVLHVGQEDLPVEVARNLLGPRVILGRSTHSPQQAALAEADPDVDYFCVGPLWQTPTKPGRPAAGVETLRKVAASKPSTPWFAIGGIDAERLDTVLEAGATRIVVVRAITGCEDPEAAARSLSRRLATA